ncbi:MAG: tRNA pseudouridine(55) synthase TruB [Actinobacteria bacterium]|nr:tRNA pseudouridine(55) synthase TruB [Actinomycetota bacterium]
MPTAEGLVVIDKPVGLTSHDVVARLRRVLATRRVGHAGTLDPMATGVLVCGVGRATRLLGLLALTDKEYIATIRLGIATHSDDATGDVVSAIGACLDDVAVESALAPQRGTISQRPSSVSAIKVDGRRAHERVRAGEDVELAAREVQVAVLEAGPVRHVLVDGVEVTDVDVRVVCSSGTYVRAIARDVGIALGVGGHLTALRRTRVGRYTIEQAQSLDALLADPPEPARVLAFADVARTEFGVLEVDENQAKAVASGVRIAVDTQLSGTVAVFAPDGRLLAVSDAVEGTLVHRMVLAD